MSNSGQANEAFQSEENDGAITVERKSIEGDGASAEYLKSSDMIYEIEDNPGWHVSIALGIQHCLLAVGGLVGLPLIFAPFLCMKEDDVGYLGRAMVINSMLFISGIITFLQSTFGVRLPIMQGGSAAYVAPIISILLLPRNQCPRQHLNTNFTNGTILYNDTDGSLVDGTELWQRRMREVQGALTVSSLVEILLSLTGVAGFLMRFIGPLTVGPCVALIGLSLIQVTGNYAGGHWGIAVFTFSLLTIFSQYLKNIKVPFWFYNRSIGCHMEKTNFFKMFSVLITVILACIFSLILTVTEVFPNDPNVLGYGGRIDVKLDVLSNAPWFRFPYPGQWGLPEVTVAGVVATIISVIISMIESIGDYHACARISNAPPPPAHAVNRGLAIEGLGSLIAGVVGTSTATTSYSQNVAAIGITKVASRRVLQVGGVILFLIGMIGKFGAVMVVIPDPVMGGLFCVMFGMILAVGISNLQYVDLNSSRNLYVIGFSIFMAMTVPTWMRANRGVINTGVAEVDQILTVMLETQLFIGFVVAVILDNTIPGTLEERGMKAWRVRTVDDGPEQLKAQGERFNSCYNLPFRTDCCRLSKYVPILPEFDGYRRKKRNADKDIV